MYDYEWDETTGGLILVNRLLSLAREPRPVYSRELDILGFNKYWRYEPNYDAPYLWAEANRYYYRGKLVAKTIGGSISSVPLLEIIEEPEKRNRKLRAIDLKSMVAKNEEVINAIEQDAIKRTYNIYTQYLGKVDVFYVAFSGGKDSVVALEIVQKALPHSEFKVLFGDTRMEFPDTYDVVRKIEQWCEEAEIEFLRSSSRQMPLDTWRRFGPPSQRIRWCCSVHKTAPQILTLRESLNKSNFRGMAFTGVRGDESLSRSRYDEVSLGEKVRAQYNCHPILNWNSAEVFLYIYSRNLIFNEAYKKGNGRVGCLVCPMATDKNIFIKEQSYGELTAPYNAIIRASYSQKLGSDEGEGAIAEFMDKSGWKARRSGRDLGFAEVNCEFETKDDYFSAIIRQERTNLDEWFKTLGEVSSLDSGKTNVRFNKRNYTITITRKERSIKIETYLKYHTKTDIQFISLLKDICRKTAYCRCCQVCEANCPFGYLSMENDVVTIDSRCVRCRKCLDVSDGCLIAFSLRQPKEDKKMGSINHYGNMGFENSWIEEFFQKGDDFWNNPSIGSKKINYLKRFLVDSEICVSKHYSLSDFGQLVAKIGFDTPTAWGLTLVNLAYTSQLNWWIKNIDFDRDYEPHEIFAKLDDDMSEDTRKHVVSAFKNIFISNSVLGREIGVGVCEYVVKGDNRVLISVKRIPWQDPDGRVVLYALYKYAEACGTVDESTKELEILRQFSLRRLMNFEIESDGVSPAEIFGIDSRTFERLLVGLSANYPDFITSEFTHDLDIVTLNTSKRSADVLDLF